MALWRTTCGGRSVVRMIPSSHRAQARSIGIFQFADIARPAIMPQHLDRFGINLLRLRPRLGGVLLQEMADEQRNVIEPLAQAGHLDRDDGQPIVEILAEIAALDFLAERLRWSPPARAH